MAETANEILTCEWLRYRVFNYAMHQNFVPIIQKLTLTNLSDEDLRQVRVTIVPESGFAETWSKTLDVIPAGQSVETGPIHLSVSGTFLAGLTERLLDRLTLSVEHDGRTLAQEESPIAVLPYDQWGGMATMPELIAAFVMPNHPAVAKIIHEAGGYLEKWTGHRSFDAYQSKNPNIVRYQAAAIYSALRDYQIAYCVAPASFDEVGQRVRLPDAVIGKRMGNCLDLSLLYASCLEAVGLHPLIIFMEGHAFPGVWLVPETFPEILQDDITALTKRLAAGIHEISVAEATLLCAGNQASYQEAEVAAKSRLQDTGDFVGLVDIKRARAGSIRPLPIRVSTAEGWTVVEHSKKRADSTEEPDEITVLQRLDTAETSAFTKQQLWERKLLDLTLRNTLLNFRRTRASLPVLFSGLVELEDALAEGKEFQLSARPQDWEKTSRSADLFRTVSKDDPLNILLREEFERGRLRVDADERELEERAAHLYRAARLSLEENGANTLYLALGLLKWYETANSELPRYAPIILVPVELVHRSSRAGYVLRLRDEDPQINITLLEMLRQNFQLSIGGLDPLPRDEKGIDIKGIFTTIRHAIMHIPRWDIIESAIIGLFSFSRFVMWNDIRNRSEDLVKNKVVASLISGKLEWDPGETFPEAEQLDDLFAPDELLLPISADSSQITAVAAALRDQSFVLHGPPGTGKSQTITNIIAASLAQGKTVLFVAEKMAALSVVQKRLESIGLGPFCLELHSNKSTKKAVLEQLRRTLEAARTAAPEEWKLQAERIAEARRELNSYVKSLHRIYGFGASLYDAISHYERYKDAPDAIGIESEVAGRIGGEQLAKWRDLVRDLRVAGTAAGDLKDHVWAEVQTTVYTPVLKSRVEEWLARYARAFEKLQASTVAVMERIVPCPLQTDAGVLEKLANIAEHLLHLPDRVPVSLLQADDQDRAWEPIRQAIAHGEARDDARAKVLAKYREEALALDAVFLLDEWRKAELKWFLPRLLKQNRIAKLLFAHAVSGPKPPKPTVPETLELINRYKREDAWLQENEKDLSRWLGDLWNRGQAHWKTVETALGWTRALYERLMHLLGDRDEVLRGMKHAAELYKDGKEAFLQKHADVFGQFLGALRECGELEAQLSQALQLDFQMLDNRRGEKEDWFAYRMRRIALCRQHTDRLRDWCNFRHVRQQALEAGLAPVVSVYESGSLRHEDLERAFERAWWKAAIQYILDHDPKLASFSGRLFEERIRAFQEMIKQFERLTRQEIAARLFARMPPVQLQAAASSEMGILLRAIRSGGRGLSLRKLFEQVSGLLTRICPCMLMSPMSVAQYLDPKHALFDLVVFDEASQMPTSEAVGAMARGRNVIVVGDPKQLPPTSFFMNVSQGDTDDGVPEDLESILDDCLAIGMPQTHLLWHYRSRHESLIAFSNRQFYENKLLTFPSPMERKSFVKWHPLEGYYDRGGTKQNPAEAEAVVKEIIRRLRDEELRRYSIGVVTFNAPQQTLIEDMLEEAFRRDPSLEEAASMMEEPIFIKNLENVQGDERDVILFSVGYGPDQNGKVVYNFGPLNREGGWRRLNVAVSRARHEMHVFSTLRAEHLDAARTRAEGVRALRAFLEYAEKGISAIDLASAESAVSGTGLETEIAKALKNQGYQVHVRVGASGFRVDLAVLHPENPNAYLLGILCDGNNYKAGKTARDREILLSQILHQLGWRILRVWSLDWLDNPDRELQRIVKAIEETRADKTADPGPLVRKSEQAEARNEPEFAEARFETAVRLNPPAAEQPEKHLRWAVPYRPVRLPEVSWPSDSFMWPEYRRAIEAQIRQVVEGEGPISKGLLLRKVLQAWGIARTGTRIASYFDRILRSMRLQRSVWDGNEFYWPDGIDPEKYEVYRVPQGEQDRRGAEDLPPEEISNAIKEILFMQGSIPKEDLVRETIRLLGYSRTGSALEKAVGLGIRCARKREIAEIHEGRLRFIMKN